jgi:hypothetical protein
VARRGRRVGTWLIVVFVVVIGLLVAVDRVGAYAAERTIAQKVSQEVKDLGIQSSSPDVTVGGFPFLTQVVGGRYERISILLRDVSANGITVPSLDVHATGVNAEMSALMSGEGSITADRVDGTATVGYSSIRALIQQDGLELSEDGGKLRLRLPLTIAGQQVTAIGVGEVRISAGKVGLAVTDIRAEGVELVPRAQSLLDEYKSRLSVEIALPPLPFGLRIEAVQVKPEGLAVTASARGVPLSS